MACSCISFHKGAKLNILPEQILEVIRESFNGNTNRENVKYYYLLRWRMSTTQNFSHNTAMDVHLPQRQSLICHGPNISTQSPQVNSHVMPLPIVGPFYLFNQITPHILPLSLHSAIGKLYKWDRELILSFSISSTSLSFSPRLLELSSEPDCVPTRWTMHVGL